MSKTLVMYVVLAIKKGILNYVQEEQEENKYLTV